MGISEILNDLLQEKGLKQADLSRITGIPTSLISNYIKGIKSPTLTNSVKLAEALEISVDRLAGICAKESLILDESETGDKNKIVLLECYDSMNPEGQDELIKYANLLVNAPQYKKCASPGKDRGGMTA